MSKSRQEEAYRVRVEAAAIAKAREHPVHKANGDEQRYAEANYAMSFTKGLKHNESTGLIEHREDFEHFRKAIDEGYVDAFTVNVPTPTAQLCEKERCPWVSPTAGRVFDLEGPDAEAVTMPPAPTLTTDELACETAKEEQTTESNQAKSRTEDEPECKKEKGERAAHSCQYQAPAADELAYEMAEIYELALLRDVPLAGFVNGTEIKKLRDAVDRLNKLDYKPGKSPGRPRAVDKHGKITAGNVFRGSSPKVDVGAISVTVSVDRQ